MTAYFFDRFVEQRNRAGCFRLRGFCFGSDTLLGVQNKLSNRLVSGLDTINKFMAERLPCVKDATIGYGFDRFRRMRASTFDRSMELRVKGIDLLLQIISMLIGDLST